MKALFLSPRLPITYWGFDYALALVGKRAAYPPLGLLTVSALLPPSWERRLVDMNIRPLRDSDIAWADLVLVGAMLVQKDSLRQVIARCKALGKRVAIGGPYVTTSARHLPEADHLFLGDVEATLPECARDLERGCARRVYQADQRPPLSATPIPDCALADLRHYQSMSVQYSRGCPFQCEFCDITAIYGRVPRTKGNGQLLAELDALRRLSAIRAAEGAWDETENRRR